MITTFSNTWKPRTGLHLAIADSAKTKIEAPETLHDWTYTRGIIIKVLGTFPEALQSVRDALAEARRTCPRDLREQPA